MSAMQLVRKVALNIGTFSHICSQTRNYSDSSYSVEQSATSLARKHATGYI